MFKNKHHSEETKKKMSETAKKSGNKPPSRKGKSLTDKHKLKISKVHKGKILSNETKQKISEAQKGIKNHLYGKHHSEETKRKMSKASKGEKNHQWQGGKSFEPYTVDWTNDLRESIRKRDNYICQLCGIHENELIGRFKKLDCHHIDYNKNNINLDNLITLCRECHIKTNSNRKKWQEYFLAS